MISWCVWRDAQIGAKVKMKKRRRKEKRVTVGGHSAGFWRPCIPHSLMPGFSWSGFIVSDLTFYFNFQIFTTFSPVYLSGSCKWFWFDVLIHRRMMKLATNPRFVTCWSAAILVFFITYFWMLQYLQVFKWPLHILLPSTFWIFCFSWFLLLNLTLSHFFDVTKKIERRKQELYFFVLQILQYYLL